MSAKLLASSPKRQAHSQVYIAKALIDCEAIARLAIEKAALSCALKQIVAALSPDGGLS
jgi:hypothetical protein